MMFCFSGLFKAIKCLCCFKVLDDQVNLSKVEVIDICLASQEMVKKLEKELLQCSNVLLLLRINYE
jgi:hypothetical protein